jgi:type IV secretory pathway VirB10-like protein
VTPPRDDADLRGPARLTPPRVRVVRLNRRLLYVVGAVLVIVAIAAAVALRAQGARLAENGGASRAALAPPSGQRWFDKVPDREPASAAVVAQAPQPAPAPALPAPTPAPAKVMTDAELEAQRLQRGLRTAMSASIAAAAFEGRSVTTRANGDDRTPGRIDVNSEAATAIVPAAARLASTVAGVVPAAASASAQSAQRPDVLSATVRGSVSPYEVKAGTIIPGVLLTGVNSDLPGQLVAQVREPVFDTETGQHLLIPQGARLVGLYGHQTVYGQERVLITWKRVIFPNGSSLSLKDGMPGTDALGAAGFQDEVNHHLVRVFGNALLLSVISAGLQLSQIPDFGQGFGGPTAGNVLGAAVGQQLGQTSSELIRRGMNVSPTIEIRPGYAFNAMVTQDIVFPGPYDDTARP